MNTQLLLTAGLVFVIVSANLLIPLYAWRRISGPARRSRSPGQVGCLPMIIGTATMCTVAGCIVPLAKISDDQIARTGSKPAIQAVTPDLDGRDVVAEGFISQENPVKAYGLAAFLRYTNHTSSRKRRLLSKMTPPLLIQLPGGETWAENPASPADADYFMENMFQRPGDPGVRTYGLARGEQVLVIGTVVSAPGGVYLDARTIFSGSLKEYLDKQQSNRMPTPVIIGLFGLGLGICAYGLWPALARRRQSEERQAPPSRRAR